MHYLQIISFVNWIAITLLFVLVMAETLFPAKGGDAASAMGKGIYYLAIIVLILLLALNLMPFRWSKYLTFGLIVVPLAWIKFGSSVGKLKRTITGIIDAKPIFEDREREDMARAIFRSKPDRLRKYLKTQSRMQESAYAYPVLVLAVKAAVNFADHPADRLACIQALLDAGVPIASRNTSEENLLFAPASMSNARVLAFLLANGADANSKVTDYGSGRRNTVPVIFESMGIASGALACVEALLAHGANPNALKPRDGDRLNVSVLLYAAERQRWDICALLIEKGADPHYVTSDGTSLGKYMAEAEPFNSDGFVTIANFERVKKSIQ
nr:hypothetical protein [uncultured Dyadobacter sp.]